MKIAYTDVHAHLGDPEAEQVPLETKLSSTYASDRAGEIGHEVGDHEPRAGREADTVYLTVVDGDGNAVSLLKSGYKPFGSGLVVGGSPCRTTRPASTSGPITRTRSNRTSGRSTR